MPAYGYGKDGIGRACQCPHSPSLLPPAVDIDEPERGKESHWRVMVGIPIADWSDSTLRHVLIGWRWRANARGKVGRVTRKNFDGWEGAAECLKWTFSCEEGPTERVPASGRPPSDTLNGLACTSLRHADGFLSTSSFSAIRGG